MLTMKKDSVLIRSATLEDATAIAALVNSAYRGDTSKKGWTTEADLLGGQRTDVKKINEMMLLLKMILLKA